MPRTKTIQNRALIDGIIHRCEACYVAMVNTANEPYVLPFNFGYEENTIYLHSAQEGTKMDILREHPQVCIAFSTDHAMRHSHDEVACSYGMKYRSVLVHGKVDFITDFEEKKRVLNIFMKKYAGREFTFNAPAINEVCVYKVVIEKITARESGY
jgi:nitroimidazol reductase NimA-like FMN-containing flavoprotein (pyridoxamine 5'-phosphate oxidase superfamily)